MRAFECRGLGAGAALLRWVLSGGVKAIRKEIKLRCEIEIDLGPLADEWEPVAFRVPVKGDMWITKANCLTGGVDSEPVVDGPRLIVRRRWVWPEWLTAEWIAMDSSGHWYGYDIEPLTATKSFSCSAGSRMLDLSLTAFVPPHCSDWKQSKRRKPRAT